MNQNQEKPTLVYQEILTDLAPFIVVREDGTEHVEPNPILKKSKPYYFTFDESGGDSVVSLSALGSDRRKMTNDRDGIIDCRHIVGKSTGAFTAWINDGRRYLSNRPLHSSLLLGNGQRPFSLPMPIYVPHSGSFTIDLVDLSDALNSIRLAFPAMRYALEYKDIMKMLSPAAKVSTPFFYTTDSDIVISSGNGEVTGYMTIDTQGDFYAKMPLFASTGAFLVRISDASGAEFGNGWIHSDMIGGNGQYNWSFEPQLFKRGGQIKLRFKDVSGVANQIWFAFAGYNAYYER